MTENSVIIIDQETCCQDTNASENKEFLHIQAAADTSQHTISKLDFKTSKILHLFQDYLTPHLSTTYVENMLILRKVATFEYFFFRQSTN